MSKTELTEKQQKFVDYLFGQLHEGAKYGPELLQEANDQAGYNSHFSHVLNSKAVKDAIYEGYKKHVSVYGLEAFSNMLDVMRNPNKKAWRAQLSAAQAVLDASTIPYKGGEQQVEAPTGVIVLPAKKKVVIQTEDDDGEIQ